LAFLAREATENGSAELTEVFGTTDNDILEAGLDFSTSNNLVFAGEGDDLIDLSQSEGGNRAYGGSGSDVFLLGKSDLEEICEADRLVGGDDSDRFFTLEGGENLVTGDEGADQFWIANAEIPESANTITDFQLGVDVLGISGLEIGFEDLSITQDGDNTLIATGEQDLAILLGVQADSLNADNFAFA
jgi:Ca2+-binding RTX toxin-like protein